MNEPTFSRTRLVELARIGQAMLPTEGRPGEALLLKLMADMLEEDEAMMRRVDEKVILIERQLSAYVESLGLK